MATTRTMIPAAAIPWLAAAREPLEELTMAALNGDITDAEFRALVEKFSKDLPGLLPKLDHAAIAEPLEEGMSDAMAHGIESRAEDGRKKAEKKAKLPWEKNTYLAGKGKKCGNSWIASWKQCGPEDGREWDPATAEEAATLARLTGKKFKPGARILATPEGIRHTEKGHKHQLNENDWKNLRGRLFDPRTARKMTATKIRESAVEFTFPRGVDLMEATFTIHPSRGQFPGALKLKTYKKLDPRDILKRKNESSGG